MKLSVEFHFCTLSRSTLLNCMMIRAGSEKHDILSYDLVCVFGGRQLIIDECGMCTEPESMIPIVSTRASQVVLVGDHMQLQPIVTEKTASRRGLGRSLFERYSEKAIMLTVQYRMVRN